MGDGKKAVLLCWYWTGPKKIKAMRGSVPPRTPHLRVLKQV